MSNEIKNVPELRFPEYSEEWEKKRLKDISKINPKLMNEFPSEFDYIDLESVYKGKINKVSRVTNENAPSRAQRVAQRGDVFFQTVRPYQQNNFVFLDDRYSTVVSTGYAQIRSNMNSFYIYNLLLTSTFLNKVLINCTGSNYPAINSNDLGNISIRISTNENEKQKIGEFFSKLDRQIELEEQKLSLLEEQKKGYMQKIFSQELRFKDGKGNNYSEWIKTNLKFLVSYKNGKGYEKEVVQNGKYNIINLNSISTKGMLKDSGKYSDFEDITLKKNDLIMILSDVAKGNLIGKTAIIDQDDKYLLNQRVASLRIKDESTSNVLFIYYFINYFRQYFINMSTGMSQLNINKSTVEDFLIYLPYIEEQDKIGNFFSNLDKSIIKQLNKIELLKQRKKGFLQKMFV